jgi:hypothetical protein
MQVPAGPVCQWPFLAQLHEQALVFVAVDWMGWGNALSESGRVWSEQEGKESCLLSLPPVDKVKVKLTAYGTTPIALPLSLFS